IYANRNTVPTEQGSPFYPSGVRLGTPLVTTRGMKEKEMVMIADWIARIVERVREQWPALPVKGRAVYIEQFRGEALQDPVLLAIRREVKLLTKQFPLFSA
ncbi:hypothetical protein KA012_04880, partial [Candidatus Woesebacteria bacterium]|nr:hypothetical protein [Candidatus Woesebacteria bacterium]